MLRRVSAINCVFLVLADSMTVDNQHWPILLALIGLFPGLHDSLAGPTLRCFHRFRLYAFRWWRCHGWNTAYMGFISLLPVSSGCYHSRNCCHWHSATSRLYPLQHLDALGGVRLGILVVQHLNALARKLGSFCGPWQI